MLLSETFVRFLGAALLLAGCASQPTRQTAHGYTWELRAEPGSGAFPSEWSEGRWPMGLLPLIAFGDKLWMTGQLAAWSSADGLTWERHDKQDWGERIGVAETHFDGRTWMLGGLMYDDLTFQNDVWSTNDGKAWQKVGQAEWPARKGHTVIPFKGKLLLLGGANGVDKDKSSNAFVNDVWSSNDGVHWTEVSAGAAWSPRESPRVVVFHDKLYLLGGQGHADVWTSADGGTWAELTPEAPWGKRFDFGAAVFDDKLWVYGGREADPKNAFNDVWSSSDGVQWVQQTEEAPWSDRSGMHSIVFKGELWLFSGKHTGASDNWAGDIWAMRKE